MIIYGVMKLNRKKNAWELLHQYRTFQEAIGDITEEEIVAIKQNKVIYTKEELTFKNMHKWTKVLLKKETNKVYLAKNSNTYRIKSFEIY